MLRISTSPQGGGDALPDAATLKRQAARRALDFVSDGMTLGLGTGTTAEAFLELLGPRVRAGLKILGVATSQRTAEKAQALGIPLTDLDSHAPLNLTVDGADEADHAFHLIKGGGGALLREKIVAASSQRMVVIADGSKLVERIGRFPLPVEVTPFGHATTATRLAAAAQRLGYEGTTMTLRVKDGAPFLTDSYNLVYDCAFGPIADVPALAAELSAVPGVVEHGLFIGLASVLVIAHDGGVDVIERK
jgi:ribose 5-phosphate isomerase A